MLYRHFLGINLATSNLCILPPNVAACTSLQHSIIHMPDQKIAGWLHLCKCTWNEINYSENAPVLYTVNAGTRQGVLEMAFSNFLYILCMNYTKEFKIYLLNMPATMLGWQILHLNNTCANRQEDKNCTHSEQLPSLSKLKFTIYWISFSTLKHFLDSCPWSGNYTNLQDVLQTGYETTIKSTGDGFRTSSHIIK